MARAAFNANVPRDAVIDGVTFDCRQLWAAVMQQAIDDLGDENERIREDARVWFHSDLTGVPSFLWICALLELDPEAVLSRLKVPEPAWAKLRAADTDGQRLKLWRIEKGLRLYDLARQLHCTKGYLSSIEHGFFPVGRYIAQKLLEIGFECRTIH